MLEGSWLSCVGKEPACPLSVIVHAAISSQGFHACIVKRTESVRLTPRFYLNPWINTDVLRVRSTMRFEFGRQSGSCRFRGFVQRRLKIFKCDNSIAHAAHRLRFHNIFSLFSEVQLPSHFPDSCSSGPFSLALPSALVTVSVI